MKTLRLLFMAGVISCLAGCGTVMRDASETIAIETVPPGATVTLPGGPSCVAPCALVVERVSSPTIKASKPGCGETFQSMPSTFPEGGTTWLSFIDYGTGRAAEHQPNPTAVKLLCNDGQAVTISPYDDATIALLHGGQLEDEVLPPVDESAYRGEQPRPSPGKLPKP